MDAYRTYFRPIARNLGKLQLTHNRPSNQTISFQAFFLNYLRFVLAGGIAGAWGHFGFLAAQMAHLGTTIAIAANETAMAAIAYDKAIRTTIESGSRKRISAEGRKKLIAMLTEEHGRAKKAIMRDNAAFNEPKLG